MRVKQIRITIVLGVISLIGIIAIQIYWLFSTWNMQQKELDQNIWLALKQVTQQINTLHNCQPNELNPVIQNSESCYIVDVSCNFNLANLEYLITTNFNKFNIQIEHELAVYNCDYNHLEYKGQYSGVGDLISLEGDLNHCLDELSEELVYFFCINISGRNFYLFKKMQLWLILSLFVIIIVCFFTYAIFSFFRQKQLSELQKDFINNMTHEFKTPISSINIASDVLIQEGGTKISERFANYAKLIKQENTRLTKLVENVLRAARIEKSKTIMEPTELDLHNVIDDVFTNNAISTSDKKISIDKELNAKNSIIIADKLHLTNVLLNLFDNAIKYNTNKTKVKISTANLNGIVLLKICDNGIGIPDQYKKQVFKKFFRVPTGNVHNVKGFGLGLFYVKEVSLAHKWRIKISNNIENGTCFTIEIKLKNE